MFVQIFVPPFLAHFLKRESKSKVKIDIAFSAPTLSGVSYENDARGIIIFIYDNT